MPGHAFVMKIKLDNVRLMVNDRHTAALCVLRPSVRFFHGSHTMLTGRHPRYNGCFLHKYARLDSKGILRGVLAGSHYPWTSRDSKIVSVTTTLGIPFVACRDISHERFLRIRFGAARKGPCAFRNVGLTSTTNRIRVSARVPRMCFFKLCLHSKHDNPSRTRRG